MTLLYKRVYKLNLGGTTITNLHMEFDILQTDKPQANTALIKVVNMSPSTRKKLTEEKELAVQLDVGFGLERSPLTTVFLGNISRNGITTNRNGPHWVTELEVADGGNEMRKSRVDVSFPAGTKVDSVIEQLVKSTKLKIGNLKKALAANKITMTEFIRGVTFSGNAHEKIVELSKSVGLRVSVQDGVYTATTFKGTVPGEGYRITPSTGLVGSPEVGEKGAIKVTSLLLPLARPHHQVSVQSENVKGFFRVKSARHSGSFRGDKWLTVLDVRAV